MKQTPITEETFPDFTLTDASGKKVQFNDLSGPRGLIVFVYPKDNTPGCTMEAQDFTRLRQEFETLGFHIVGISQDNAESHANFIATCALDIPLLSDPNRTLIEAIGAWGEKNLYGKVSTGIIRSTFIIDGKKNLIQRYKNVKATGHADKILKELKQSLR